MFGPIIRFFKAFFWITCFSCRKDFRPKEWDAFSPFSVLDGYKVCPACTKALADQSLQLVMQARRAAAIPMSPVALFDFLQSIKEKNDERN